MQSPPPQRFPPGVPDTYAYPQVPVTRLLDDAAKDFPESTAVDVAGHRLTYRQVVDQVDRLATALRGLGTGPGDRVGLLLPHSPQHLIALFGTWRAGATAVLLEPEADIAAEVNAAGCRVLVCPSWAYPRLEGLKGRLPTVRHILATGPEDYLPFPRNVAFPVVGRRDGSYRRIPKEEGVARFKDLIRRTAPEPLAVGTDAPAVICGDLAFDHAALVAGAFQVRLWVPDVQAGRERLLSAVSPHGPFGLGVLLGLGVLAASTILFPPRPEQPVGRAVLRAHPTLVAATPAVFSELVAEAEVLESLRVGLADGPMDPVVTKAVHESVGGRVRGGMAVPGAVGLVHAEPVYGRAKPGSVGLALPDTHTAVVAADGTPLPAGEVGTIVVQGPQTARRRGADAAPAAGTDEPPWLRTDRLGHLDAEGYLWLEEQA